MSKTVNKYITALDYTDKTLLVSSGARSGVSLCLYTTTIGVLVRIASDTINLMCLINNEIIKMFFKQMRRKKINTEILLYWMEAN